MDASWPTIAQRMRVPSTTNLFLPVILLCLALCLITDAKMDDHDGEKPAVTQKPQEEASADSKQPDSEKNSESATGPDPAKVCTLAAVVFDHFL